MASRTIAESDGIIVYDYCCEAGPGDRPFAELHDNFSVAYVRKGSFGYQARGRAFELVAGSLLIGHPGHNTSARMTTMFAATSAFRSSSRPIWRRRPASSRARGNPAVFRRSLSWWCSGSWRRPQPKAEAT